MTERHQVSLLVPQDPKPMQLLHSPIIPLSICRFVSAEAEPKRGAMGQSHSTYSAPVTMLEDEHLSIDFFLWEQKAWHKGRAEAKAKEEERKEGRPTERSLSYLIFSGVGIAQLVRRQTRD